MTNSSYRLDAYRSHDLSIYMRTSSGDTISMDFSNKSALSLSLEQNKSGAKGDFSFSSMQEFNFSMDSNGIDAQDKKEIEAFMKTAQPYIDSFLKELKEDAPKSPINKIARDIASEFAPMKQKDEDTKNFTKSSIVDMFDRSIKNMQTPKKEMQDMQEVTKTLFEDAKTLLEKTLKAFEDFNKNIYA